MLTQTDKDGKEIGRVCSGGMGSFLCPPLHPEHKFNVETDLWRRKENRSSMSLSYAVTCDWLAEVTRQEAEELLAQWEQDKLPLSSPVVKSWIEQVMTHFQHCFGNFLLPDGENAFNASNVLILPVPYYKKKELAELANLTLTYEPDGRVTLANPDTYPMEGSFYTLTHAGVHYIQGYYPEYVPAFVDYVGANS